jgi:hypothetical protein
MTRTDVRRPGVVAFFAAMLIPSCTVAGADGTVAGADGGGAGADGTVAGADGGGAPPQPGSLPGSMEGIEPEAHSHVPPYADGNGNLYRVVEEFYRPEPNHNTPRMMKSGDGGATWVEVDEANRPTDRDLEGSWFLQAGTALIYVYTDDRWVSYSSFNTSDAATNPDTWQVRDEQGITGLSAGSQQWTCAARTNDGQAWVFFSDTLAGSNKQLAFIRRDTAGAWSPKTRISTDADSFAGATCVVDPVTDVTHVFHHDYANKQVFYRSLTAAGVLSEPIRIDTTGTDTAIRNYNAVTNPVVYTAGGSTVVTAMFASASGVRAVSISDGVVGAEQVVDTAAPVISPDNSDKNTGNDGPVMHLAVHGSTVHALWAVASTGDVWHSSRPHGGAWTPPGRVVDSGAGTVSWLYANVVTLGGADILGYTYDMGPHLDNAGDIRFDRVPL